MADYEIHECSEAMEIAQELIPAHHGHLVEARILYLHSTQEKKSHGRMVCGDCRLLSGFTKYLSSGSADDIEDGYDFAITVYEAGWDHATPKERTALIDHELSHGWFSDSEDKTTGEITRTWKLRGHDIEEFHDVVSRNGLWSEDLRRFAKVAKQATLDELEEIRVGGLAAIDGLAKQRSGVDTTTISYKGESVTVTTDQLQYAADHVDELIDAAGAASR